MVTKNRQPPPASAASFGMNMLAVVMFCGAWAGFRKFFPGWGAVPLACISLLAAALPLWWSDLVVQKVHLRPTAGLTSRPRPYHFGRILRKLAALYFTLLIIYSYYILIHARFQATYLSTFLELVHRVWPLILVLCAVYVAEIDRRQSDPHDEYWRVGGLVTGDFANISAKVLWDYTRSWFVKGFFTPYVFLILVRYLESLGRFHPGGSGFLAWHAQLLDFMYMVDILFAVLGYVFTCRVLDTHIRSTDPTVLGWLVCLMCYGPFHTYFGIGLFNYDDGLSWHHWLGKEPWFYFFYGGAILFLTAVYALATVAIGYRMSNLTYRGLITTGPYRFTKHPAYLAKVGSWWLISVPFFSVAGGDAALKHSAALLFISLIYFLRAKTEENHLSNYPEYVAYAEWINDHGAFKTFKKWFPALRYNPESHKKWGSLLR
ncbi:MAG: hypothetical protein KC897_00255 [Candidatus Omnitrophica bacterium]|nr:hypothetical protein [Candidatus Omnitrophota bacterium]MCB9721993.1 hypothetical protein [Candidatus Omnitrophota bacterium]